MKTSGPYFSCDPPLFKAAKRLFYQDCPAECFRKRKMRIFRSAFSLIIICLLRQTVFLSLKLCEVFDCYKNTNHVRKRSSYRLLVCWFCFWAKIVKSQNPQFSNHSFLSYFFERGSEAVRRYRERPTLKKIFASDHIHYKNTNHVRKRSSYRLLVYFGFAFGQKS